MTVKKLSVALDESVAAQVTAAAEAEGLSLSAWLNRAAVGALAVAEGLDAVAAWEREHGKLTKAELADADRLLDEILRTRGKRTRRAS